MPYPITPNNSVVSRHTTNIKAYSLIVFVHSELLLMYMYLCVLLCIHVQSSVKSFHVPNISNTLYSLWEVGISVLIHPYVSVMTAVAYSVYPLVNCCLPFVCVHIVVYDVY